MRILVEGGGPIDPKATNTASSEKDSYTVYDALKLAAEIASGSNGAKGPQQEALKQVDAILNEHKIADLMFLKNMKKVFTALDIDFIKNLKEGDPILRNTNKMSAV